MEVAKNIKYFKLYISQFFFFLCTIKGQSYNDLSIDLDQAYFNLNELNFETYISADSLNNGKLKINSFQFGFDKINFDNIKDCLLYTSPSPRDRTRSRMPSSA